MYRQGDVMLVPRDPSTLPKPRGMRYVYRQENAGWWPEGGIVLAQGEETGHHHRVKGQTAREYRHEGKRILTVGEQGATLTHEEHDPINLPAGTYEIVRQREYVPAEERNPRERETSRPRRWSWASD